MSPAQPAPPSREANTPASVVAACAASIAAVFEDSADDVAADARVQKAMLATAREPKTTVTHRYVGPHIPLMMLL